MLFVICWVLKHKISKNQIKTLFVICWVVKHKVASLVNHSWRRERSGRQKRCSTKSKRFKGFDEIADFFKDSSEEKENEMKTEVADKMLLYKIQNV